MSSIIQALICVFLWAANAMPTNEVRSWEAPHPSKSGYIWKATGNRHHLWQFPKFIECGSKYKDLEGLSGYDAAYLIKYAKEATIKTSNAYDLAQCDKGVQCYRSVSAPYADQTLLMQLDFRVKDDVKGAGQLIQFTILRIMKKDTAQGVHDCSSPEKNKDWWNIPTGNKDRPAGPWQSIPTPPQLHG